MANAYCFPGKMNDQQLNILFVGEVEKRPVLYNFTLPGYSNKDETERAWVEVGRQVNMLSSECKERWKNLRAVFVRHMKPSKGGAGAKAKKAYYLSEAMRFTIPYIKALGASSENLPSPTQEKEESEQYEDSDNDSVSLSERLPPIITPPPTAITEFSPRKDHLFKPSASQTSNRKHHSHNDQAFVKDIQTKKKRMLIKSDHASQDPKTEALKMFLLSMLPDLQQMTDEEVRRFKRKTLDAVDEIFSARPTTSPQIPFSSGCSAPPSQSEATLNSEQAPDYICGTRVTSEGFMVKSELLE